MSGKMDAFKGTLLSCDASASNNRNTAGTSATPARGSTTAALNTPATPGTHGQTAVYQSSQIPVTRGNTPQQNRIIDFLARNPNQEGGISMANIKAGVKGDNCFESDFHTLAENGVIFSTLDDDHYSLVL